MDANQLKIALDTVWVLIAAFMVFFMHTGFAMLESGLCRSKNTVNILSKNFIVFAVASLSFYIVGWGLMFGGGNGFVGTEGLFALGGADNSPATGDDYQGAYAALNWAGIPLYAKFFFQLVFVATAATIVSGAVAERVRFLAFIGFSFLMAAVIYPVVGHWVWGGGWLQGLGMWDFAGSTVVHSVGGWAALAGVLLLGPRFGKYSKKDGHVIPLPGHSMPLATLGTLILWLGWFGFNAGSTMAADADTIARIAVTTNMAAAASAISAAFTAWLFLKKPEISMILNGALGGLVAITAPCAFVSPISAVVIGLLAGFLTVVSVIFWDRLRIDDPVGVLSVHLVNGIFGTLAVGLFAQDRFMPGTTGNGMLMGGGVDLFAHQLIGILAVGVFTFTVSFAAWLLIRATMGIRVSEEQERMGLDLTEHANEAYPDFQLTRH